MCIKIYEVIQCISSYSQTKILRYFLVLWDKICTLGQKLFVLASYSHTLIFVFLMVGYLFSDSFYLSYSCMHRINITL